MPGARKLDFRFFSCYNIFVHDGKCSGRHKRSEVMFGQIAQKVIRSREQIFRLLLLFIYVIIFLSSLSLA